MRRLLLVLISFFLSIGIYAERISRNEALEKAQQFMPGKQFGEARSLSRSVGPSNDEPFYIFNAEGNKGFVIVSGDDRTQPIIGYADRGQFSVDNMPANLKYWLDAYEQQIKYLGNHPVAATRGHTRTSRDKVNPLILTEWNQDAPYNTKCPQIYNSYTKQYEYPMTGCVATAMAQVMFFWKWPQTATPDIPEYTTESLGLKVPSLPAVTFDWDNMQTTYNGDETETSANAVATLLRYCGQAVEMDYGLSSSTAGVIPFDMVTNFGYGKNARQVSRFLYSSSAWEDMIYKEVSEGRPVLYGGSSVSGGHEFICDGYENGYFHFNWGWGGMSNGFFLLSLANPYDLGIGGGTSTDGYSIDQHAIIGLEPDNGEAEKPYIHGIIDDDLGWVTDYSRSSAGVDFTEVSLPGVIIIGYDYYSDDEVWPDYEFECGWGLYQDGVLKTVLGVSSLTLSKDVYWGYNAPMISFGKGLADGVYMLSQVYRPKSSEEWLPCETSTYKMSYIVATISGTTLTLRKAAEEDYTPNITINSVNYSVSSFEVGKPVEVTVNLTNNGDAFQELVCFWYGSQKTIVCGSVESGKTGTVQLHFSPYASGEMPVKISTDTKGSNMIWSETISVAAAKPQVLSATATTPGLDGETLTGTTLKVNLKVKNEGSNIYENVIQLCLCKNTETPPYYGGPIVIAKSVMATIQPGETKTIEYTIPKLNPTIQYCFFVSYFSGGKETDLEIPGVGYPFYPTAQAAIPGDVNEDGDVNDKDVKAIADMIMSGTYNAKADLNEDNKVNAADIVFLVKMIK